jgi:EpsI family protein
MIRHSAVRIGIIAALIPLTWWGSRLVNASLEAPGVDMPDWTFAQMPMQIGDWRGEDDPNVDEKINNATEAKRDTIVNRIYQDGLGHTVHVHTAMFDNPKGGVYHSPLNCCRSQGWEKRSETRQEIEIDEDEKGSIPVSVTQWERKGEKMAVVYWYQLGPHVLFGRWDLGLKVRWSLAGKPAWPALIKVMFSSSTSALDSKSEEDVQSALLGLVQGVARWENQPSHRYAKGMLGTAAGEGGE